MLANERLDKIREKIDEKGAATVNELANELNVSIETVRRDLLKLEQCKRLTRVRGGAVSVARMKNYKSLDSRNKEMFLEKRELALVAAKTVREGDCIGIDSGSTAVIFAEALKEKFSSLTVVTHSLDVFNVFRGDKNFNVILASGYFLEDENAFYGSFVMDTLNKLRLSKVYLCPTAISLEGGICDFESKLYDVQKQLLKISDTAFFLADSSKFEKKALLKLDDVKSEYVFVTDSKINDEIVEIYRENGIEIMR